MRRAVLRPAAGLAALCTGSLLWGWGFERIPLLGHLDTSGYRLVFEGPHYRLIDELAHPFDYNLFFHIPGLPEDMPTFFYFMIGAAALYLWRYRPTEAGRFLLAVLAGNLLVHLVTLLDTHLAFRVRPFLALHEQIDPVAYQAWRFLSSYPSGHCRDTALYSTLIAWYLPRLRWPALALVLFIMFSRVYLGAHYPSDVVGGALIGVAAAYLAQAVVRLLKSPRDAGSSPSGRAARQ